MSTIPTHDAPLVHEPNILRGFPTNREPLLFLTWITGQPQIADLKNGRHRVAIPPASCQRN